MEKFPSPESSQPNQESSLTGNIRKSIRSIVAGAMLGASTIGSAGAQEVASPRVIENTVSKPPHSDELEPLRNERVKILQDEITEKIAVLESYNNREKFDEYYLTQKKEEERQVQLRNFDERSKLFTQIKELIKTLSEDEIRILSEKIVTEDALWVEYGEKEKGDEYHQRADSALQSLSSSIEKHPAIQDVMQDGGPLETWLENNTHQFIDAYNSINSMNAEGTAKQPSEIFCKVFDTINDGQRQYLNTWLDEKYSPEKLDSWWKDRPSEELLRLQIDFEKHELENIQSNLKEALVSEYIDTAKMEVLEYICSPEYLRKLIEKEGMTVEQANEMQMKRFESVINVDYSIENEYGGNSTVSVEDSLVNMRLNAYDVAHYPKTNPHHEFVHVALRGDKNITEFERKVYEAAGISKEEYSQITNSPVGVVNEIKFDQWTGGMPKTLVSPAELAPRKLVLEFEMERLGIKKRFEEMTHEHYLQVVELVRSGKLKHNSAQIILTTTEKGLLSIMNSLAFEDTSKKNNTLTA